MKSSEKNLESVLNKLKKLKALYESAKEIKSEGEANAAASAIQKLLTQYNLSMEEIGSDEQKKSDNVSEEKVSGYTYKSIGGKWELNLLYVLCKWNYCRCFQYGNSYKSLILFGKKENLETVKWLKEMLSEKFVNFSKNRYKEYKESEEWATKPMCKDTYQRSYLMGCGLGLNDKFKADDEAEKAKDAKLGEKITALAINNTSAVVSYINNKYSVGTSRKQARTKVDSSFNFGYSDARKTNINKQVGSSAKASTAKKLG